ARLQRGALRGLHGAALHAAGGLPDLAPSDAGRAARFPAAADAGHGLPAEPRRALDAPLPELVAVPLRRAGLRTLRHVLLSLGLRAALWRQGGAALGLPAPVPAQPAHGAGDRPRRAPALRGGGAPPLARSAARGGGAGAQDRLGGRPARP